MSIFFQPQDGVAADFIPFWWNGSYHLFYLKDYRDVPTHGEGTPWFQIVTRDFVNFDDWGEALPRGTREEQDLSVFTGSVIERHGTFHLFYTGDNPHVKAVGKPGQAILHATSPDLKHWTKDRDFYFEAPAGYERHDWRDPFVYWSAEANEYHMLITAKHATGPQRNRGVIALAGSADLREWEMREPLWAPSLYSTHECPDLFRIGEWWYLVWSEYSRGMVTRYAMARTPHGPWLAPADDRFDDRQYYAAKTAGDGRDRYLFGWLSTKAENCDKGHGQWGGVLVVHQLVQRPDGTLGVAPPESVMAACSPVEVREPHGVLGHWIIDADGMRAAAPDHLALLGAGPLPETGSLDLTVSWTAGTAACGLILRAQELACPAPEWINAYEVRLEPARNRLTVLRWNQETVGGPPLIERTVPLDDKLSVRLRAIIDGSCLVLYVDDVALSCRIYDLRDGHWGLLVSQGEARFELLSPKSGT